jgi:hypothetical protein
LQKNKTNQTRTVKKGRHTTQKARLGEYLKKKWESKCMAGKLEVQTAD